MHELRIRVSLVLRDTRGPGAENDDGRLGREGEQCAEELVEKVLVEE